MTAREPGDADGARELGISGEETVEDWLKHAAGVSSRPAALNRGTHLRPGDTLRAERLRIVRRIGEGGMGVVFEAFDAERGEGVALKTVSNLDPEGIYRFKNEFRSLADVSHRNLCRLYELFNDQGDWFFTMELVAGEPFDRYVRPDGELHEPRLRAAMSQLCDAIGAIHAAGQLHRDLKPSNVLVTEEGRVVVLDFGLATDREQGGVGETISDGHVSGTPSYMAPEQAAAAPATTASDLYALGVMLFEALTGRLPFEGPLVRVFVNKVDQDAPRASKRAAGVPDDLDALCAELLARAQDERPSLDAVRARLGPVSAGPLVSAAPSPGVRSSIAPPPAAAALPLVGRERELGTLLAACRTAVEGKATVLFVSGESGMGKSALVSAFLEAQRASGDAVVLAGRCNEREDVPFKAFDALVDQLSRYLRKLPRAEAMAALPIDVFALARLFPVLERVDVVAEAPARSISDAPELRRRAFAAFGELLARIRNWRPLTVFIDDLQWVDADSVLFMRALLVDPDPAPILVVLGHRSEGAEHNQRLAAIREVASANAALLVRTLELEPLADDAARALALQALPADHEGRDAVVEHIVSEAGGSPFFVTTLAQHAARGAEALSPLSLSQLLAGQLDLLSPAARRLLEVSALSGRPLSLELLLAASGASHNALDDLRAQHLVRLGVTEHGKTLECYHDRIRESIAIQLSDATRRERHASLASALVAQPDADPELLATCFEGAGRASEAARYAALAAERAERGMAFDRAAELYKRALALGSQDAPEHLGHLIALAEALGNAGRAKEAAAAYLAAASDVAGREAIELRRRAGVQLLTGGYPKEGEATIRAVCADVGIAVPAGQTKVMLDYFLMQARLRLKKPPAPRPQPEPLSPETQLRLDVGRAAVHFGVDDPMLGMWGGSKYLLLASAAGDPAHLAWALSFEGYNYTMLSPTSEKHIAGLFAHAVEHAKVASQVEIDGVVKMHEGIGFAFGRAMTAETGRKIMLEALELLQGRRGMRFQIDVLNLYLTRAPSADLPREARRSALLIEEAFSLGRPWTGGHMAAMSAPARLLVNDGAGFARHLDQAARAWQPQPTLQWMDATAFEARAYLAFHRGDPSDTLEDVQRLWPLYERSALRRSGIGVGLMHAHRGVSALWAARLSPASSARARELATLARADHKQLAKGAFHPFQSLVLALQTGLALFAGDREGAMAVLRGYLQRGTQSVLFGGSELLAARRLLGQLSGGDEGQRMTQSAEDALRAMGVVDLDRGCQMLLPGCFAA